MVQIVCVHVTASQHRENILEKGLEARYPKEHNYKSLTDQPKGVYATFTDNPRLWWIHGDDFYRITYCGPVMPDPAFIGFPAAAALRVVVLEDLEPSAIRLFHHDELKYDSIRWGNDDSYDLFQENSFNV